jgi:carboxymethylenebutenolidase
VIFRTEGGSEVGGYLSKPKIDGEYPGVVIGHEWWGVDAHFRELSRDLAGEGYIALIPDLYDGAITDDWDEAAGLKADLNLRIATRKLIAGASFLLSLSSVAGGIGMLGFCMGGGVALLALAEGDALDAAVVYYPSIYPDAEDVRAIDCPVMLHYGVDDEATPKLEVDRLRQLFNEAEVPVTYHEYEGASHAFTNPEYEPLYNEAAAETAWPRTIELFDSHL